MKRLLLLKNEAGTPYSFIAFLICFNIVFILIALSIIEAQKTNTGGQVLGYACLVYSTISLLYKMAKWKTFKNAWFADPL